MVRTVSNHQCWLMVADSWAAVPTVAGIQMRAHGSVTAVWRNQQLQELILVLGHIAGRFTTVWQCRSAHNAATQPALDHWHYNSCNLDRAHRYFSNMRTIFTSLELPYIYRVFTPPDFGPHFMFQQALNNIDIDIGQILLVAACTSHNLLHIVTKLLPPYFIALNLMV